VSAIASKIDCKSREFRANQAAMRALIALSALLPQVKAAPKPDTAGEPAERCPKCGGRMLIIERFEGACRPRKTPSPARRFDTS